MVFARNKRKNIEKCLQTALQQSTPGLEIIFSDQGSTDGTREVMQAYADKYDGPHSVRVIDCPDRTPQGMTGMNQHLNWIMTQVQTDVAIVTAADDYSEPDRSRKVMEAYEEFDADVVLTSQTFLDVDNPESERAGRTDFVSDARFVTGGEIIERLIGGSGSQSWRTDFYQRIGGCTGICPQDIYFCFLAAQGRGCYWLPDNLHTYVMRADAGNTGLEGVHRLAKYAGDSDRVHQIEELMQYQITSSYFYLAERTKELFPDVDSSEYSLLLAHILSRAYTWAKMRDVLTYGGIPPLPMVA